MERPDNDVLVAFGALRANLLRGDLGGLDAHLSTISAFGKKVADGAHGSVELDKVRAEAERNRDILAAAAGGVRAALRRLGEAGAPTTVYARDGSRMPLAVSSPARGSRA